MWGGGVCWLKRCGREAGGGARSLQPQHSHPPPPQDAGVNGEGGDYEEGDEGEELDPLAPAPEWTGDTEAAEEGAAGGEGGGEGLEETPYEEGEAAAA